MVVSKSESCFSGSETGNDEETRDEPTNLKTVNQNFMKKSKNFFSIIFNFSKMKQAMLLML